MAEATTPCELKALELQRHKRRKFHEVYLLGLAIKLGGFVASWHNGFAAGLWPYLICVVIVALGYFCLTLCISEMVSVVAFPGGYYGYVRCGIGPLTGFLVGCSGLIEAIFILAVSVLKISQACLIIFDLSSDYMPIFWVIAYIILLLVHIRGVQAFWLFMETCTVISILFFLIYLFGSMPNLNLAEWAYGTEGYHSGTNGGLSNVDLDLFFRVFRLPAWMFIGVDLLSLACDEVEEAKASVPVALTSVMSTLALLAVWLTFTVACQSPGLIPSFFNLQTIFPLSFGYSTALGIPFRFATIFVLIPLFGSCTGYLFAVGRQMNNMARSGLFPAWLKGTIGKEQTPINAMLIGCTIGLAALFGVWRYDPYTALFRLAILGGCPVYIAMFACFLVFRSRYSHMERGFVNPLGLFSAALGTIIFLLIFATLIKYQTETKIMTAYFTVIGFMILYYYLYAESRQFFSAKEQSIFLKAYVVNFNMRKKEAVHRRFVADVRAVILDTFCFWCPNRRQKLEEAHERTKSWERKQREERQQQRDLEKAQKRIQKLELRMSITKYTEQSLLSETLKRATFRFSKKPNTTVHNKPTTGRVINMSKVASIDECDCHSHKLIFEETCEINFFAPPPVDLNEQNLIKSNQQSYDEPNHLSHNIDREAGTSLPSVEGNSISRVAPSIVPDSHYLDRRSLDCLSDDGKPEGLLVIDSKSSEDKH